MNALLVARALGRRSCCARSGASATPARPAPWIPTPAVCAASSTPTTAASWSTAGAWGTGWSTA